MKIGILGTGIVGRTLSAKLAQGGNDVMMGTRDVASLMERSAGGEQESFSEWQRANPRVKIAEFGGAAEFGEVVINATSGLASLEVLGHIGQNRLTGKILIDVANALDFSKGMPPLLAYCNNDSLGERIQQALPHTKVVKTLNTMNAQVMVDPRAIGGGDHHVFLSGNDPIAKRKVADYLRIWFGWKNAIDLGDITTARGTEMLMPVWLRLWGVLETPLFNFKIVKA